MLIGTVLGILNNKLRFNEDYFVKEDYELCCSEINKENNVVRFNMYTANALHKSKGGCEEDWKNFEKQKNCCDNLVKTYSNIVAYNTSKENEVRFIYGKKNKNIAIKNDTRLKRNYPSPRWTGELSDCSIPLTFDTYSNCSFGCLYCFSQFQRTLSCNAKDRYMSKGVTSVNPEHIKQIFEFERCPEFHQYIRQRKVMQWGGLSDQFDGYEKKYGITLELLKYFKKINYPLCLSTKAVWWLNDDRYTDLFEGQKNWNCKFSIITANEKKAKAVEIGVPTPDERLKAIEKFTSLNAGGATLRLRPFIIGVSSDDYLELIERAYKAGATAVSTEFMCMESRAIPAVKEKYKLISEQCGFDIYEFYRKYSQSTGYLRLNRKIKEPYINKMQALCEKFGMRFYVSDAHFKERCSNSCCCGLPDTPEFNYSRGNFSYALQLCKKNGKVTFKEIEKYMHFLDDTQYIAGGGFNTGSAERRAKFREMDMREYLQYLWNNPKQGQSPYKMFGGIMYPDGLDSEGNVIYIYKGEK